MVDIANHSFGYDGIANNPPLIAEGTLDVIQLSDGSGGLRVNDNVYVASDGTLHATAFKGDGGLLSNVASGSGNPSGPTNSIQYNAGSSTFGGSSDFVYDGTSVTLTNGLFIGDGGGLSNVGGSGTINSGTVGQIAYYTDANELSSISLLTANTSNNTVVIDSNLWVSASGTVGLGGNTNSSTTLSVNGNVFVQSLSNNSVIYTNGSNVLTTSPGITFDETTRIFSVDTDGGALIRNLNYGKFTENVKKGQAVYISGVTGANVDYSLTDDDVSSKMPAIGLAIQDYSTNDHGYACIAGTVYNVKGSGASNIFNEEITSGDENKVVYVNGVGKLTLTRPTLATSLIQNIGRILKVSGTNVDILVQGAGRTNDTPNRLTAVDGSVSERLTIGSSSINSASNLYVTGNVYVSSGIQSGGLFTGDGGGLSNVSGTNDTLADVINRGNVTSNVVQFSNSTTGLVITETDASIHFNSNIQLTAGGNSTFVDSIRSSNTISANVLGITSTNEIISTDMLNFGDKQIIVGNKTFVSLVEKSCNNGATTNVLVFNLASPEAGIFRVSGSMVEGSNASIHQMAWIAKNPAGTQSFINIESFGSNDSPWGISTFNIYTAKDDTSDDTDKFTLGVTLGGSTGGTSAVSLFVENIGYNEPYLRLSREL